MLLALQKSACVGYLLNADYSDELDAEHLLAPHIWDEAVDESLPALNLVSRGQQSLKPLQRCLSNSFAFGGNNVSVIIGK